MKRATLAGSFFSLLVSCLSLPAAAQVLVPTDPSLPPLAIKSQRVSVEVKDQVARTHIEQVFQSNSNVNLEATYVFPIPDDIAVSEFAMWMNGKKVIGEVLEADKARGVYEQIVARTRDPGLLEFAGKRMLRARVFPIPARGEQKIEVEYGEVTKMENGVGRYVYPLATGGKSSRVQDNLALKAVIHSTVAIKTVYSPTHKVSVDKKGDHDVIAGFEEKGAALDRDFTLFWTVSEKDVGLNLVTFKERDSEDGYFVVMLAPKTDVAKTDVMPKDVTFVIDTSGSMDDGKKMDKAKEALTFVLGTLNEKDRFNVIRFSTGVENFANDLVPASADEIAKARKFVKGLEAAGGTAIDDALAEALKMKNEAGRPSMIVFITDGEPTIGETEPEQILKNVDKRIPKNVRIFSFGVGADLNALLLDRLSNEHGGAPEYAAGGEEIEAKVSSFAQKVNSPVMTDLTVDFGKMATYDVYPKNVPDLFKGGQVTLFGRYKSSGAAAITLAGNLQGKKQSMTYEGTFASKATEKGDEDANSFIPRLWATRKVGFLLDEIRSKGEKPELKDEVVSLSRKFGIVSPYTSYLVVEDNEIAMNGPRPPMPVRRDEERTRSWIPWGGGGKGSSSGAMAPKSSATPAATSMSKNAEAKVATGGDYGRGGYAADAMAEPAPASIAQSSGETGVHVARVLKDKREKEVLDHDDSTGMKRAAGKTLTRKNGGWMDVDFTGSEKLLKVKYLSAAWFSIVRLHPELREALSVGERVTVVVAISLKRGAKGRGGRVNDDGADKLDDSAIKAFF